MKERFRVPVDSDHNPLVYAHAIVISIHSLASTHATALLYSPHR